MKQPIVIAQKIHDRLFKGITDVSTQLLNEQLSPIELALVSMRLYDLAGDYHKGIILRQLENAQEEHFVLDSSGKVVVVFEDLESARHQVVRLGKGYSIISGASK